MKIFNTREDMVESLVGKSGVYAEIGVFKGTFSDYLYDKLTPKTLVLIDLFDGIVGSGDQDGNNFQYADVNYTYTSLKQMESVKNIHVKKGDSSSILAAYPNNTFDMIYIDGDHSYDGVKRDLEVAIRKIKPGGWLMGHDYEMNMAKAQTHYEFGVRRAVDEFCSKYNQQIFAKGMDGCVSFAIQIEKQPKNLVYYTIGYNDTYLPLLEISIKSLRKYEPKIDIAIICDESLSAKCNEMFSTQNVILLTCSNSQSAQKASMNKLLIFNYPIVEDYDKIMYIDADIIVYREIASLLDKVVLPNYLYVYSETTNVEDHSKLYWSLQSYQKPHMDFFAKYNIHVFNAGCFLFVNTIEMKTHFSEINKAITNHTGAYFYEQSFMNVYFNTRNLTIRDVLTKDNYKLGYVDDDTDYRGMLVHYAGHENRESSMKKYFTKFISPE